MPHLECSFWYTDMVYAQKRFHSCSYEVHFLPKSIKYAFKIKKFL